VNFSEMLQHPFVHLYRLSGRDVISQYRHKTNVDHRERVCRRRSRWPELAARMTTHPGVTRLRRPLRSPHHGLLEVILRVIR
jgi:hypothetical protein